MEFTIPYRPPFEWPFLLSFLSLRASPGVESVEGSTYRRTFSWDGEAHSLVVRLDPANRRLLVQTGCESAAAERTLRRRIARVFDLSAPVDLIGTRMRQDPLLAAAADDNPGIRVPGSWDGFETAVRAILGQRISVKAATAVAGRLVERFGQVVTEPSSPLLDRLFPTPECLLDADMSGLGLTGKKIESVRALARQVATGALDLTGGTDSEEVLERLLALPGIGPWTAQYVAMRALGVTDAFPSGDLILQRSAEQLSGASLSERDLLRLSESWRPWRAYAAMLLWASYASSTTRSARGEERDR